MYHEVMDSFEVAGIEPGDRVLLHSNFRRTAYKHRITPTEYLKFWLDYLGRNGTLLLPIFNFGFCEGEPFDWYTTPSRMGVLSEDARTWPSGRMTHHPVYRFAVPGNRFGLYYYENSDEAFSFCSPFAWLHREGGKIAVLDLDDQSSMTYYHYCEAQHPKQVHWRYSKRFKGNYTDADGDTETRTFEIFVRNREAGYQTHVNPCGELMWQAGLYQGERPGVGGGLRAIRADAMYYFVSSIILAGAAEGRLYKKAQTGA